MRVFLDTNVLVSALATRGLCAELFEVVLQDHDLLISEALLDELNRVLRTKLGQSTSIVEAYLTLLRSRGNLVTSERASPRLPDPDDEPIVAAARTGEAEVFVTGDKALLELGTVASLPVLSPREFWERLSEG